MDSPSTTVGDCYASTRLRLTEFLRGCNADDWTAPVAACPGWRVHDVLAHLVGVIEDAAEGRISGPPEPDQTAAEVERHRWDESVDLLQRWSALGPAFESAISQGSRWPAFIDALTHEHDIRGALGSQEHRDHADVVRAAGLLSSGIPAGLGVDFGDGIILGDGIVVGDAEPVSVMHTTPFEFFRLRMGRRSLPQVGRLDWSSPPGRRLDRLFVFGPAADDVRE